MSRDESEQAMLSSVDGNLTKFGAQKLISLHSDSTDRSIREVLTPTLIDSKR